MIKYTLELDKHHLHLIDLKLVLESDQPKYTLKMATWIPGSYLIRDFAKNIISLKAFCNKKPVDVIKKDNATFVLDNPGGQVTVEYQIYAFDRSVRGAHCDDQHVFFNGTSIFFDIPELSNESIEVTWDRPSSKQSKDWSVATTLPEKKVNKKGFGTYHAPDYQTLIDHPVEIGHFSLHTFKVNHVEHAIAISGKHFADVDVLVEDVQKICQTQAALFDNDIPFDRYLFLLTVMENNYGGLEHRSSSALICSRYDLNNKVDKDNNKDYTNLLGLFSHEYFHAWNVKRIKPLEFEPYDLTQPTMTTLLWVFEGFTSYYDELALIRAKVISENAYLELLAKNITRYFHNPGKDSQSLQDSSFDAWIKFYKADENAANSIANYYTNGALAAFCMDKMIRQATQGQKSLDDVMRLLWQRHGKEIKGLQHQDVLDILQQVSGIDMQSEIEKMIQSCEPLPLSETCEAMGLSLQTEYRHPKSDIETENSVSEHACMSLGIKCLPNSLTVRTVLKDSLAEKCGIYANDQLLAIDDIQLSSNNYAKILEGLQSNAKITIHVFRENQLVKCEGNLETNLYPVAKVLKIDDQKCKHWLNL